MAGLSNAAAKSASSARTRLAAAPRTSCRSPRSRHGSRGRAGTRTIWLRTGHPAPVPARGGPAAGGSGPSGRECRAGLDGGWLAGHAVIVVVSPCRIAAKRPWAASSWLAIMSLTSASSGVSGRRISSRKAGTSGPYLPASLGSFGPVRWMMPTALSVKSETLMHPCPRAGRQAGQDVLAVLLVLVAAGLPFGVGDRGDQLGGADAELPGQHGQGGRPPAGGDVWRRGPRRRRAGARRRPRPGR